MSRAASRAPRSLRRVARILGEPPEATWPTRIAHHGARVVLLLVTALAVYLLFPAPRVPDAAVLERGVVAPHDVIAEFSFQIPKSDQELLRSQAEAASGVPPAFEYRPAAADSVVAGANAFFATVDSIVANTPAPEQRAALQALTERNRIAATPTATTALLDPARRGAIRASIIEAARELMPRGVLPSQLAAESFSAARIQEQGAERLEPRDSLLSPERFFGLALQYLPDGVGADAAELQRLLLIRLFQPSLRYDAAGTDAARARARAAVDPIEAMVLRGEKVVGAHEQIGLREEERLRAYQASLEQRGLDDRGEATWPRVFGAFLFNALVLLILGLHFWFFRRPVYHSFRSVLLFSLLVLAVVGSAALIASFELPSELIPVTFAVLIVAVLWDGRLALTFAVLLALLIGGQTPFLGITVPFSAALGGAAAAFSVRIVQRRSRRLLFISIISAAYIASAVTIGLLRSRELQEMLWGMSYGIVNAIVASLLAIGFLPLLESFTRITTDETLLELSDLNRTLLKRLSLEASGTYHHTINVANLAEAACNAIGAQGLLARVGAYYHDIGKLAKPQYFIENQPRGRNPHDKLKPAMSAAIIRSHVVDGLKLADEQRLPGIVRNFIAEHHGTQQISFFYDRAREADPEAALNPADFSYPGPKPQTKETAVLMMSDSVESASRVLQDPSPERIRELVERIVSGKIVAGQLDQCPLTLREIDIVKEYLGNVLGGMYHHRIDYPPQPAPTVDPDDVQPMVAGSGVTAGG